jgi:hypothetical protein
VKQAQENQPTSCLRERSHPAFIGLSRRLTLISKNSAEAQIDGCWNGTASVPVPLTDLRERQSQKHGHHRSNANR